MADKSLLSLSKLVSSYIAVAFVVTLVVDLCMVFLLGLHLTPTQATGAAVLGLVGAVLFHRLWIALRRAGHSDGKPEA